jgi:hypothetical protein
VAFAIAERPELIRDFCPAGQFFTAFSPSPVQSFRTARQLIN